MGDAQDNATPAISVDRAIEQYLDSVEAGNSRKNFQSALQHANIETTINLTRTFRRRRQLSKSVICSMSEKAR